MNEQQKIEKEKEIVIAQLETAPPDLGFFDGSGATSYSRDEIIQRIKDNDPIGLEYVRGKFKFLRAVANGEVQRKIIDTYIIYGQSHPHHEPRS